jgi:3-oxoacyl-[acyl-carrier protein] reductase
MNQKQDEKIKVAMVTGASRGIGRAVAKRLGEEKFKVAVIFNKGADQGEKVVAEIIDRGGDAAAFKANVASSSDVIRLFTEVLNKYGGIDVVVNNAGVNTDRPIPVVETTDEEFDRIFNTNTRGAFYVMREAAKSLNQGGRIINVSTSVTSLALPGYGTYAASKAAVELFTKILSKELRGRNISVNAIAPGPTDTELFRQGKSDEALKRFAEMSPLGRLGQSEDIAGMVSFLSSKDGEWINGQVLRVNGGIV